MLWVHGKSLETIHKVPFWLLPSRHMNSREISRHKIHSLLDVGWQKSKGMPGPRGCGSMTGEGVGLHLDGVQSEVKDGTLLWSEISCFFSHHVVLETQKKQ